MSLSIGQCKRKMKKVKQLVKNSNNGNEGSIPIYSKLPLTEKLVENVIDNICNEIGSHRGIG